jgi:error-prone DNA polymerase
MCWPAGAAATLDAAQLPGMTTGMDAPTLPQMTEVEETLADLWATGTYGTHPVAHAREALTARGVLRASDLASPAAAAANSVVMVAGLVIHRQRPPTARGVVFLSLEDETGIANVICPPHVWDRHRESAAAAAPALVVSGRVERASGAVSLIAVALRPLRAATIRSRDFR